MAIRIKRYSPRWETTKLFLAMFGFIISLVVMFFLYFEMVDKKVETPYDLLILITCFMVLSFIWKKIIEKT